MYLNIKIGLFEFSISIKKTVVLAILILLC